MPENNKLETANTARFQFLKSVVNDGMAACYIVGEALREIKENKLYELDGHKSFEEFCHKEWQFGKRYCNALILDADTIKGLPDSMRSWIKSESAARALSAIPKALRPAVLEAATDGGKKPATQSAIQSLAPPRKKKSATAEREGTIPDQAPATSAPKRKKESKPKGPVDATGVEVPVEILPLWARWDEGEESAILVHAGALRIHLEGRREAKDPLYTEVDLTDDIAKLKQIETDLHRAKPYAVCRSCSGKLAKDCHACKGRGFVSKFYYDTCVPEEIKNLKPVK